MSEVISIRGIECYEENGVAYLNLETVARGLGFTETKGGKEYIMWRRVGGYLESFGFDTSAERIRFIPENIFYRLAMKAKNETAEKFQALVADEIIPSIRKSGTYGVPQSTSKQIQLLAQGYTGLEQKVTDVEKRIEVLEDTSVSDSRQRAKLKEAGVRAVVEALGGKGSNAYNNESLRTRVFQIMWHEYKAHFGLTSYHDTPKARFTEALSYLGVWEPSTNLKLSIKACNEEVA